MPYYRCTSCLLLSYSAANHSTVGRCAHCDTPLAKSVEVEHELPRARSRRFEPMASATTRPGSAQ